jgi:hypothetical protein
MNKTILIVIGIACAVITAVGIMWYSNFRCNAPLIVSTHIMTLSPQDEAAMFLDKPSMKPMKPFIDNKPVKSFVIMGGEFIGTPEDLKYLEDIRSIEKQALAYMNRGPYLMEHSRYRSAEAELRFSSDRTLARYKLTLYESATNGKYEVVTFSKDGNRWVQGSYITQGRFFRCTSNCGGSNKKKEEIQKAKQK